MSTKQRIEEFTRDGKNFIYYDLSDFKTNEDEFEVFTKTAKKCISKYSEYSVLTIINIRDVKFNSETKNIVVNWIRYNKPYVKFGAIIGVDGIRKIMANTMLKLSGRKNMAFISNKEKAIEFLLKK